MSIGTWTSGIYSTTINCVQIWVSTSDRTTPIEREMESPVETHTSSLLSSGRAATYTRVVSGLLSYTQYDGRVAACTRMESGPPACGPASPRQPFRYFRQGVTKRCRLSWLTNSAHVSEPKCGGRGDAGLRQLLQLCTKSPSKFWRYNSIFNLWF